MSLIHAGPRPDRIHRRRIPTLASGRAMLTIALTAVIAVAVTGVSPSAALGGARTTSDVEKLWRAYPLEQTPTTQAPAEQHTAGRDASAEDGVPQSGSGVARTAALLGGAAALVLIGVIVVASSGRDQRAAPPAEPPVQSGPAPAPGDTDVVHAPRPRFERDTARVEPERKSATAIRRGPVCQIRWSARGRRSCFEAFVVDEDGVKNRVARSPRVERPGSSPPEQTPEAKAALRALAKELRDDGWKPLRAKGKDYGEQQWYARRFRRPVELDEDQAAEPAPAEAHEGRRNVGS
jgi:hypothetical protein